jgi:peptidoglycan/LPS O-acetylase OafA/YrhL
MPACCFVLFFRFNRRLRSRPVLRFLAASSSAVYLVHGVIERTAFDAVMAAGRGCRGRRAAGRDLGWCCVIYLWVERPLLAAGHPVARWLRPKTAPAADRAVLPLR